MSEIFFLVAKYNGLITSWNVCSVTNTYLIFDWAMLFNQNLENSDVDQVIIHINFDRNTNVN